ncbi:hypothetical protein GE09DRAFT_125180 [Coniochaeta sp. 2T2.1]|nr:hypothetical protein GE09DRAFT_125180 [Coniochaeta sp. 2T2.1]
MSYSAQRVPAWKRLGLKLKGPASGESPAPASSANAMPAASAPAQQQSSPASANLKRKQPPPTSAPISRGPDKRQRTDTVVPSPKKSVKFSEDTKTPEDKPGAEPKKAPKKTKKKKKAPKPAAAEPAEAFNLEPSLAYLRQWQNDRESWKFNKNHQTLVIKYFFDAGRIRAADVPIFLAYIRDLKGFIRSRLRDEAAEIKKKDMADGAGAFAQVKEKADKESKQELYEEVLSKLLQLGKQDGESSTDKGNGKRTFDEAGFAAQEEMDVDVKQRAIKRMRAELVLQELSESEESTTSAATTTTTSSATEEKKAEPAIAEKKVASKPTDGTQPLKRRRLRKSRTADISDDSSSDRMTRARVRMRKISLGREQRLSRMEMTRRVTRMTVIRSQMFRVTRIQMTKVGGQTWRLTTGR